MTTLSPATPSEIRNLPDGPSTPRWLQTIQLIFNPIEYLEAARARYGDTFVGHAFGFPPFVVLSHPQAIQQIFTAAPDCFDTASGNAIMRPLVGDRSLALLDGADHQQQRKLLMPPFHGERMRAYGETIRDVTEQVMRRWSPNQPFRMQTATQEITLRVILRTVFGLDQGERFEALRQRLSSLLNLFNSPWGSSLLFLRFIQKDWGAWSPWGRFLRLQQQIDQLLLAEIRDRQTQPPGEDILSLMMAARGENGEPMTVEELHDELMMLLVAGHETTASALAWAFYWTHKLPEVRQPLLDELSSLRPETDPSEITKLPYLNAVCAETLRIYPVGLFTFARALKKPMQVMGYPLEAGTSLTPCIYLVHHREDLYPEPKQFKPERFLNRHFSPYEYLPFGGGSRRCLGQAFALFEMKLVLATVLTQVKLHLVDQHPVRPTRRGITFTPSGDVSMVVLEGAQQPGWRI